MNGLLPAIGTQGRNYRLVTGEDFQGLLRKHGQGWDGTEDGLPVGLLKSPTTVIRGIDQENLRVDFTITTPSVDREGDTIKTSGWQLKNYRRNPVVLFAHDSRSLPVAQAPKVRREGDSLTSRETQFTNQEENPFGFMVFRLIVGKFLRATSVGFLPTEWQRAEDEDRKWGIDFLKQELLEFSVVPVPANPEALVMNALDAGIDMRPIKAWAEQVCDTWDDEHPLLVQRETVERWHRDAPAGGRATPPDKDLRTRNLGTMQEQHIKSAVDEVWKALRDDEDSVAPFITDSSDDAALVIAAAPLLGAEFDGTVLWAALEERALEPLEIEAPWDADPGAWGTYCSLFNMELARSPAIQILAVLDDPAVIDVVAGDNAEWHRHLEVLRDAWVIMGLDKMRLHVEVSLEDDDAEAPATPAPASPAELDVEVDEADPPPGGWRASAAARSSGAQLAEVLAEAFSDVGARIRRSFEPPEEFEAEFRVVDGRLVILGIDWAEDESISVGVVARLDVDRERGTALVTLELPVGEDDPLLDDIEISPVRASGPTEGGGRSASQALASPAAQPNKAGGVTLDDLREMMKRIAGDAVKGAIRKHRGRLD